MPQFNKTHFERYLNTNPDLCKGQYDHVIPYVIKHGLKHNLICSLKYGTWLRTKDPQLFNSAFLTYCEKNNIQPRLVNETKLTN